MMPLNKKNLNPQNFTQQFSPFPLIFVNKKLLKNIIFFGKDKIKNIFNNNYLIFSYYQILNKT